MAALPKKRSGGAPKGNKNALGCTTSGQPQIYTDEWIQNEAKLFREWLQKPDSLYFSSFAIERGYCLQRLTEFADRSIEFSETLRFAKDWQQCRLINCGLKNETNPGITKFVLINNHGWADKSQVEQALAQQIATGIVSYAEALGKGEGWQPPQKQS